MKINLRLLFCCAAASLFISATLSGIQYRKGNELYLSEDFNEDLILWGGTINFDGNIQGDIIACARTVTFGGMMDGNLIAAGQRVTVNGEIHRSARGFAQTLNIDSRIDGDVAGFAADITLASDGVIGRDCALFGGEIFLNGTVNRDAYIQGGTVTIAGKINGNATIKADHISISPDAVIGGDFSYTSKEKASISPQAQILGETKWKKRARSSETSDAGSWIPWPRGLFWSAIFLLGSLLLGTIIILLKRGWVTSLGQEIRKNAFLDGLIGTAVIVIMPVLAILTGVTLVGLPVALLGLTLYGLIFLVAKVLVGITVGTLLLGLLRKNGKVSLGWSLLLGMLLLAIFFKIPVVGWIVYFVTWAVGAGAMTMMLFKRKTVAVVGQASAQT